MNLQKIKDRLMLDEGCSLTVYKDHLGFDTVGIGHLVRSKEGLKEGDVITEEWCDQLFLADLTLAIADARSVVIDDFDLLPETIQGVLVNMAFNLGLTGLSEFHKMIEAIDGGDWIRMADEMINSKWYKQVGKRGERLVEDVLTYYESEIDTPTGEVMA